MSVRAYLLVSLTACSPNVDVVDGGGNPGGSGAGAWTSDGAGGAGASDGTGGASPTTGCTPGMEPETLATGLWCYFAQGLEASDGYVYFDPGDSNLARVPRDGGAVEMLVEGVLRFVDAGPELLLVRRDADCDDACNRVVLFDKATQTESVVASGLGYVSALGRADAGIYVFHATDFVDGLSVYALDLFHFGMPAERLLEGEREVESMTVSSGAVHFIAFDDGGDWRMRRLDLSTLEVEALESGEAWIDSFAHGNHVVWATVNDGIWRAPVDGGPSEPFDPGFAFAFAAQSPDSDDLYYVDGVTMPDMRVARISSGGGRAATVVTGVELASALAVDDSCIYYIEQGDDCVDGGSLASLKRAPK
ncbi:MAG: hypothetical protein HOW73_31660 [Polyangiaceae bacterium]|nr:hypothetical protein [Polyangiaceae bacterium]